MVNEVLYVRKSYIFPLMGCRAAPSTRSDDIPVHLVVKTRVCLWEMLTAAAYPANVVLGSPAVPTCLKMIYLALDNRSASAHYSAGKVGDY